MAIPQGKFYVELGQRLRRARQAASMTQEELATVVGFTRTSITNVEKGRQPLLAHHLAQIADALRVAPADLIPPVETISVQDPVAQAAELPQEAREFFAKVMRLTPIPAD